ncbi:MAG: lysophospholipid acyltransferase family protein [Candidatus Coatesbacteria bacterium]
MIKRSIDWLGASVLLALVAVLRRLGDRGADRLARAAAGMARIAVPSRRRVAMRNLRRAFGTSRNDPELGAILRDAYVHAATAFTDLALLYRLPPNGFGSRLEVRGEEHLKNAVARGKGVVGVSAHFGPFPMLGVAVPTLGVPLSFLYRRPKNPRVAALFADWQARAGCGIIEDAPRHLAGRRCLEALGRGGCVCLLVDQHYPAGVVVPFFGHPARTAIGAAFLAARSGAPLVPMRLTRVSPGRFRLTIDPPIEPPADRSREALTACTARLTACVEGWIREDPGAWFWVHRRWKDLDRQEDARVP